MTDKLSSPSSSSAYSPNQRSNGNGSGSSGDESSYLAIRRHPPKYVYSNESFDVEVHLETSKMASPPNQQAQSTELVATLHHAKSGRECSGEAILITEPSRIVLSPERKVCTIKCMIRMDGIRRDQGAALELRFAPRPDLSPTNIVGAATTPINIVNYKVKISLEEEWEHVWYKDEGGRDKSMEIFVSIYDKDGQVRTGEQIPLKPILCYSADGDGSPVKVSNQEVLRTLGSTKICIDKDSGKTRIRFRVEDVSKNHQGQDFKLEVGPDPKAKVFKDVAPDYTPAVNVRSKRNKRSRSQAGGGVGGRAHHERRSSSPIVSQGRPAYGGPQEMPFEGSDLTSIRESMKGVINWADEVVNGLYPLQWQVMGYNQHPDGSPDYSRPYHNMTNPNGCISRILSMYNDSVRENLRTLLNAVEQAGGARPDEQPYLPMATSIPRELEDPYGMMRSPPGPMHLQPGMPPQPGSRRSGMLTTMGPDTPDNLMQPYQLRGQMPPMIHQTLPPGQPMPSHYMEGGGMMHPGQPQQRRMLPPQSQEIPIQRQLEPEILDGSLESEVAYVLAKQYKALRTGERLGFPAYSANKEILGFYHESNGKVGVGSFNPLSRHRNDFGPLQVLQANEILEDAIAKKSEAVHALKDWGSMANLLDHALVYDWSKDIGNDPSTSPGD